MDIVDLPAIVYVAARHIGPLSGIGAAFQTIGAFGQRAGLFPGGKMLGICWDDPAATPDRIRYDAAVSIDRAVALEPGIRLAALPAMSWAHERHVGPYDGLGRAFRRIHEGVAARDDLVFAGVGSLEIYGDMPANPAEAVTDCYLPVLRLPWKP